MEKRALGRLEMLNQLKLNDAQKNDVLAFFAKREEDVVSLDTIDTTEVEPMVHVIPTVIDLHEDFIEQPFAREELQAQAPQTDTGYFCVPRVIE